MDEEYANYYTSQIMEILLREFSSPDEEMKKVVLKVVSQCSSTDGVTAGYLKEHVLDEFFKSFWVRRMALDKRNYRQVVETTVDIGQKVGVGEIVERIVNNLKDESEAYRKMTVETIEKVIASLGAADIGERLEERLIDGILHSFQEQSVEDIVMLNGFGTVVNALGARCKPYLPQIVSTILWRLNNKSATVRQQAADLISRIAMVMKQCGEDALMGKLGIVLYEYLGEEYPEVLGSILGALRSIVTVVGISQMQPPIKDLLPRLTPILRNRHEKVQENTIDLVGRIADRGPEAVNAREWMRICFELLDMLKAHKKGIRRAANNTFGFIAKAIGPQDVLATLLNNLRVQERQSRVCTAVAIGIVAETCAPFTVLPALMNEYRVPELNVQNGVLKSLSFLFEVSTLPTPPPIYLILIYFPVHWRNGQRLCLCYNPSSRGCTHRSRPSASSNRRVSRQARRPRRRRSWLRRRHGPSSQPSLPQPVRDLTPRHRSHHRSRRRHSHGYRSRPDHELRLGWIVPPRQKGQSALLGNL